MQTTKNKTDPRDKNNWFDSTSPKTYWSQYKKAVELALESVNDTFFIEAVSLVLDAAKKGKTIFVCGNGGSAAIAEHLTCDWTKGASSSKLKIKTQSLSSNGSLISAIANDFTYDEIFSKQLELLANPGDVLITISSSGNSPNIIKAIEKAKIMDVKTIGFTGFQGGQSKEISDIALHVNFSNYAIVEDAHQSVMQAMAQYIFRSMA